MRIQHKKCVLKPIQKIFFWPSFTCSFFDSKSNSYENVLSFPLKEAREKFEKDYLTSQLKKHKGNISKTAEFVGMERSALHRKLRTLGIKGVN